MLITVDCLRNDYFTWYHMPQTFNLIKDWAFFTNAFSHGPDTPSSFPTIMTSAYSLMYGDYPRLGPMRTALAEILSKNGLITCGITQNTFHGRALGYARGFKHFYNFVSPRGVERMRFALKTPSFALEILVKKALFGMEAFIIPAPLITGLAIKMLKDKLLGRRFFLWIHYMDIHHPFGLNLLNLLTLKKPLGRARRLFSTRWGIRQDLKSDIIDCYVAALRQVDSAISALLEFLDGAGVLDDTLVVITADHGEEFFEHGAFGHGCKLYDELLHIPLVIYAQDFVKRRSKFDGLVGLIDVPTTVLSALGISKPRNFMGNELLSEEGDGQPTFRPYVISEVGHGEREPFKSNRRWYKYSLRTKRWKLIYRPHTGQIELFDLKNDPREIHDISDERPDIVDELMKPLRKHIRMELVSVIKAKARKISKHALVRL